MRLIPFFLFTIFSINKHTAIFSILKSLLTLLFPSAIFLTFPLQHKSFEICVHVSCFHFSTPALLNTYRFWSLILHQNCCCHAPVAKPLSQVLTPIMGASDSLSFFTWLPRLHTLPGFPPTSLAASHSPFLVLSPNLSVEVAHFLGPEPLCFSIYTHSLVDFIQSLYSVNSQVSTSSPDLCSEIQSNISNCRLGSSKTELLILPPKSVSPLASLMQLHPSSCIS